MCECWPILCGVGCLAESTTQILKCVTCTVYSTFILQIRHGNDVEVTVLNYLHNKMNSVVEFESCVLLDGSYLVLDCLGLLF